MRAGVGHVRERPFERRGRAPHHERVLAVVLVVAPAHARRAEALALVQVDRDALERRTSSVKRACSSSTRG